MPDSCNNMNNPNQLAVEGYPIENITFNLEKGFNLIGFPREIVMPIKSYLSSMGNDLNGVMYFNGTHWLTYQKDAPMNSLVNISPGYGIWVISNRSFNWTYS